MPATDQDWARGYAVQALSDLSVWETLRNAHAHKCHRLHFLQMAAEKVCKAYLTALNGHEHVRRVHTYVERVLPTVARQFYGMINDDNDITQWELAAIKRLAREIEVLAPACDAGGAREDNTEYPWLDSQENVQVPCEYNFASIDDGIMKREVPRLIRLIRTAAESYAVKTT